MYDELKERLKRYSLGEVVDVLDMKKAEEAISILEDVVKSLEEEVTSLSYNRCNNLMMMIKQFHLKFGLGYAGKPRALDEGLSGFRVSFMGEELDEYILACDEEDKEKMLDALVDLVYVALGTAYLHGFDFNEAFRRVHQANMKKVRAKSAKDSKRGSEFDVVKPQGWEPASLKDLVE